MNFPHAPIMLVTAVLILSHCSLVRSSRLQKMAPEVSVSIPAAGAVNSVDTAASVAPDTLIIRNVDGRDMILLRTIRDENGEQVANQLLEAAHVTARFRNVAERHGKVDIEFQIIVPEYLRDSRWQLRYTPTMFILGDSVKLDKVMITGDEYRRRQLKGYQQYRRFLSRILADDYCFVDTSALEIFIRRNIPDLYAFRNDSSIVSDEHFKSSFGVDQEQAILHYTRKLAIRHNEKLKSMKESKFRKYVKVPMENDGVRLDTVLGGVGGDFIYNYIQSVATRPKLKRLDICVDGEVFRQENRICSITRSDTLNFYISSVSAFVDDSPRFITHIIERRAEASCSYNIDFRSGSWMLDESLGSNASKVAEVKANLLALAMNEMFELDSITVISGASPEGAERYNRILSSKRSDGICRYFQGFLAHAADSLCREEGVRIEVDEAMGSKVCSKDRNSGIRFRSRALGEDWEMLDNLVARSPSITEEGKAEYLALRKEPDADRRERQMKGRNWYISMREELYPALRSVEFAFHMHRRGMVKDTIHTTAIDSCYMEGVQAIKDRDYTRAIELLRPYNDYNTAVAYCAGDFNHSALSILQRCPKTARVNYMLALIYARLGEERKAVEHYMESCSQDSKFIHRGNLDPEIHSLITLYNITFK